MMIPMTRSDLITSIYRYQTVLSSKLPESKFGVKSQLFGSKHGQQRFPSAKKRVPSKMSTLQHYCFPSKQRNPFWFFQWSISVFPSQSCVGRGLLQRIESNISRNHRKWKWKWKHLTTFTFIGTAAYCWWFKIRSPPLKLYETQKLPATDGTLICTLSLPEQWTGQRHFQTLDLKESTTTRYGFGRKTPQLQLHRTIASLWY